MNSNKYYSLKINITETTATTMTTRILQFRDHKLKDSTLHIPQPKAKISKQTTLDVANDGTTLTEFKRIKIKQIQ